MNTRCKPGDLVEVLYSDCGNKGRRGVVSHEIVVQCIPRWHVVGSFNGYDCSQHGFGLFMDMDLRPILGPEETQLAEPDSTALQGDAT